jgi:hypothetical protein
MDVQGNNGDGDGELNDGSMDMSMRRKISHIGRYL